MMEEKEEDEKANNVWMSKEEGEGPKAKKEKRNSNNSNNRNRDCGDLTRAKRDRHGFTHGNYARYYGYRFNRASAEDPRLNVLRKEWFCGKDCLDVGCNDGYLTICIAIKFLCRSMLGVDIDEGLIKQAQKNLYQAITNPGVKWPTPEYSGSSDANCLPENIDKGKIFFKRVKFRAENFVKAVELEQECAKETYDTILCLSVTKWVHLNGGDSGLIRLFAGISHLLRPGGVLILEPQPWKSYKKRKGLSEVTMKNYKELALRPEHFPELLLDKIGFRHMEQVSSDVPNSASGFNRPIFLFYK